MNKTEDKIQREIEEAWASKSQAEKDEIMSRHPAKGKRKQYGDTVEGGVMETGF